jgi:hypothetical protein
VVGALSKNTGENPQFVVWVERARPRNFRECRSHPPHLTKH